MINEIKHFKDKKTVTFRFENSNFENFQIELTYDDLKKLISNVHPDAAYLINYYLI